MTRDMSPPQPVVPPWAARSLRSEALTLDLLIAAGSLRVQVAKLHMRALAGQLARLRGRR